MLSPPSSVTLQQSFAWVVTDDVELGPKIGTALRRERATVLLVRSRDELRDRLHAERRPDAALVDLRMRGAWSCFPSLIAKFVGCVALADVACADDVLACHKAGVDRCLLRSEDTAAIVGELRVSVARARARHRDYDRFGVLEARRRVSRRTEKTAAITRHDLLACIERACDDYPLLSDPDGLQILRELVVERRDYAEIALHRGCERRTVRRRIASTAERAGVGTEAALVLVLLQYLYPRMEANTP